LRISVLVNRDWSAAGLAGVARNGDQPRAIRSDVERGSGGSVYALRDYPRFSVRALGDPCLAFQIPKSVDLKASPHSRHDDWFIPVRDVKPAINRKGFGALGYD
jgi:hypothetical protein